MLLVKRILTILIALSLLIGLGVVAALLLVHILPATRLQQLILAVSAVVFSLALIIAAFNFYVNHGFANQSDIIRRVRTSEKLVSFTFDDGPSPEYTPAILDVLRTYDVQASFFVVGKYVRRYPNIVKRMYSEGHDVGNHTFDHVNAPTTPAASLSSQILSTNIEIMKIIGEHPQYVRPPRGMYDARFRRLAELMGMNLVLWSISSQDWRGSTTPEKMKTRIVNRVRPGDILLFHDGGNLIGSEGASRQRTVDALPEIIEELHSMGYRIVPLSRLLRYPASSNGTEENGEDSLDR
ncbi:MAG: polysaccharide deacetylase family protein [Bacillota bacterium]